MIQLESKDYSELMELISILDNVKLEMAHNPLFNTVWLNGPHETEIYLKSGYKDDLIISRICFTHRHIGIGTAVLDWLIKHAKEKGFKGITVESVCTTAMDNFCKKYNFKSVEHMGMKVDGMWMGNYYLSF